MSRSDRLVRAGRHTAIIGLFLVTLFPGTILAASRGPGKVAFFPEGTKPSCTFKVELAVTHEEQARGLMFRERLADDEGMLFIFGKDEERAFWMRNTLIPLDIIFIDSRFKVVSVHDFAKPKDETSISSRFPAKYVVEVKGGKAATCRINAGTRVKIVTSSQ
ncbi:MAG TPA: DUF192 domain-containing protein [Syntrophorhabdaceae bacterium]|jgi:hypothetical protein